MSVHSKTGGGGSRASDEDTKTAVKVGESTRVPSPTCRHWPIGAPHLAALRGLPRQASQQLRLCILTSSEILTILVLQRCESGHL
jgi:hypothetical protein